jgi:lysophospholipase L1-like esterase
LGYEIINQGIGGYVFEKDIVAEIPFLPNKIIVALGINNHQYDASENRRRISEFFEALCALYPSIKILALLPIYCGNPHIEMLDEKVQTIKALIREIAAGYANVQVIDADDMVPHFADYYMEDMVHPNALGMELYGQNLAKAIKKIKF